MFERVIGKKAQVTIFVIVALVFGVSFGLYSLLNNTKVIEKNYPLEINALHSLIQGCINQKSESGIYYVSARGGYYFTPELSDDLGYPYYDYKGENKMPSKETVEEQISAYVTEEVGLCVGNFDDLPDYNINTSTISTETRIYDDEVVVKINYPIIIQKDQETYKFEKFNEARIPVRLGIVYNAISEFTQEQIKYDSICLSCISDICEKYDLYSKMTPIQGNTSVV